MWLWPVGVLVVLGIIAAIVMALSGRLAGVLVLPTSTAEVMPANTPIPPSEPTVAPVQSGETARPAPTTAAPAASSAVSQPQSPACPDQRSIISYPSMNAVVSGVVPIIGTAQHERFQYYKLEWGAGKNPQKWSYFDGGQQPVKGGKLGSLDTGALVPGTYTIQVVVVDIKGDYPPPCQVVVEVQSFGGSTPATGGGRRYIVQRGDTLFSIATRFGVTVSALQQANNITDPNQLQLGMELRIP